MTGYEPLMERVAAAASSAGRDPGSVTVVAVSKTMSAEQIMAVYEQGHRDFGENRAAELASKAEDLPDDIRWHFVGALQSRKAREVRDVTYLLHSMDRRSLATAWLKGMGPAPPCLLQVNIGEEPQKAGVTPAGAEALLTRLLELGIRPGGLMAIPPIPDSPEDSRPHFRRLAELRDQLSDDFAGLDELSMGMTDDFEVAIAEGASIIRVGRAIFGPRNQPEPK